MNRHAFRWQGVAFGALFLALAGNWAVWEQDLLSPDELGLAWSVLLIVAGVVGVVATFTRPRTKPITTPEPDTDTHTDTRIDIDGTDTVIDPDPENPEEDHDQAAHPQP